jgi:rod shape-determining protein MreB and related proteins
MSTPGHSLRGLFSGGPFYVRVNRTRLNMRDVSSGESFEVLAKLGLDGANRIVAIGDMSAPGIVRVLEPFDHPRVVIADGLAASKLFQYGMQQMTRTKWISPAPILVIQSDMDLAGGLSEMENRALLELGKDAGARRTIVHYGKALSDQDVMTLVKSG